MLTRDFVARLTLEVRRAVCGTEDGRGLCDEVSLAVWSACRTADTPVEVVYGQYGDEWHFWVEVDGWIVDGTAAQFGRRRPVVVVRADRAWRYRGVDRFSSDAEFVRLWRETLMWADAAEMLALRAQWEDAALKSLAESEGWDREEAASA